MSRLSDIEDILRPLKPKLDLAYLDYIEKAGCSEYMEDFWNRYAKLKHIWDELVHERKILLRENK